MPTAAVYLFWVLWEPL